MIFRSVPVLVLTLFVSACGPGTSDSDTTASSGGDKTTTASTGVTTGETPTTTTVTDPTLSTSVTSVTGETGETTSTTDATSTGGESSTVDPTDATTATTGEPECPAQLPEDGTPCTFEGQFCGGPCDDPCAFCNVTKCEGGVWQHLEVFPNNCLECDAVCDFVVPAGCEAGPPTKDACVTGCQDVQASDCKIAFNKMLSCIGGEPMFVCDADGRPVVEACLPEFTELQMCMGG